MENNKHIINTLMISGTVFAIIIFLFEPVCLFKLIFHVPCSICGMTRAFKFILKGDLLSAIKFNILSVPLFICITLFIILYLINIILKKDYIYKFYDLIVKNHKILIAILIINWLYNIFIFFS